MLKPEDYQFLRDRRRLIKSWPLVGGSTMIFLLAVYAWMAIQQPAVTNPVWVYNGLMKNELSQETLRMLALLAPSLMTMLFVTVGIFLSYGFSIMRREKRLLNMIDQLIGGQKE